MKIKKILLFSILLIFISSCKNKGTVLPEASIGESEILSYSIEIKNTITMEHSDITEEIITYGSYSQDYINDGHIILKMIFNDFFVIRNGNIEKIDLSNLLLGSELLRFYNHSEKTLTINFYKLDKGLLDYEYINNFLNNNMINENILNNTGDIFSSSPFLNKTNKDIVLEKGHKFQIKNRHKNGSEQKVMWLVKEIENNICTLKGRGTLKYPPIKNIDHNLQGTILITENVNITTGQTIDSTTSTSAYGLLINGDLNEPIKLKITDQYQLTKVNQQ